MMIVRIMAYDVVNVEPRGSPKKTWKEVFEMDLKLSMSDALDRKKRRDLVRHGKEDGAVGGRDNE